MNRSKLLLFLMLVLVLVAPARSIAQEPVTLELWTYWQAAADWYIEAAEQYKEIAPNVTVNVTVIGYEDMHNNLQIALQSGGVCAPDISDIEQGRFGGFLRGGDPGLVDLTPYLEAGGYMDDLIPGRQALYSYQGKMYGLEQALTPVILL